MLSSGEAMIDRGLQPKVLQIDGQIESIYIYFRDNVPIKEALKLSFNPFGRVLVYVGIDNLPVAFQFVDPCPKEVLASCPPSSAPYDHNAVKFILFGIACKMIAFNEASQRRLGGALIKDAIEAMNSLRCDNCEQSAA